MPLDAVVVGPFQDGTTGELCPIIADNAGGLTIDANQRIQLPRYTGARDAGVGHQTQVLTAAIVVHRQDAEPIESSTLADRLGLINNQRRYHH